MLFVSEFRFLKRLTPVHGWYSYNRTAFLSQYSFYKSLLICFIKILLLNPSTFAGWFCQSLFHLIVAAGMVPILAIKYFRYAYAPSKINILQQAERLGGPILSLGNFERQQRLILKDFAPVSITQSQNINPVYEL
ncbi:PREDICTED: phospholipid-transporting ATPase 2-like isoform X2 [Populus euphratica]|uniref:Phospholipid-transporting ATPase 2-like isoform X2 n=1 Tax=Populus euphratica TaxID=75702 RepID=A0AAJ6VHB6_POPEU|nr:PREDICTED: phospholipid-transporting ATPase 2-like isoform X2 [Populus euphratica]